MVERSSRVFNMCDWFRCLSFWRETSIASYFSLTSTSLNRELKELSSCYGFSSVSSRLRRSHCWSAISSFFLICSFVYEIYLSAINLMIYFSDKVFEFASSKAYPSKLSSSWVLPPAKSSYRSQEILLLLWSTSCILLSLNTRLIARLPFLPASCPVAPCCVPTVCEKSILNMLSLLLLYIYIVSCGASRLRKGMKSLSQCHLTSSLMSGN